MAEALYKGFSSFEFQKNKSFKLTDVELVKLDLLNHIFTTRGSRVMMPTYGTQIPSLTFEPLDSEVLMILEDELREVFDFDPRVQVITIHLTPYVDENRVHASVRLRYIELQIEEDFELNIQFEA